jgi:hypothetical protein
MKLEQATKADRVIDQCELPTVPIQANENQRGSQIKNPLGSSDQRLHQRDSSNAWWPCTDYTLVTQRRIDRRDGATISLLPRRPPAR